MQFTAVLFCWILVAYFGRRTLYLWGVGFNIVFLLATGIAASAGKTDASMWLQAVFMIMIYAQYGLTIGPITYAVIAETSSIRLRAKSVGIARNFYYIVAITSGISESHGYVIPKVGDCFADMELRHSQHVHAQPDRLGYEGQGGVRMGGDSLSRLDLLLLFPPRVQGSLVPRAGHLVPPKDPGEAICDHCHRRAG